MRPELAESARPAGPTGHIVAVPAKKKRLSSGPHVQLIFGLNYTNFSAFQ